jgi:CheY-like chemotaxis protein/HPt (histidine-containing phosphotransfer) domain-containing protein
MEKRYSFYEWVLSVCYLPKVRKIVLPALIIAFAVLLLFIKVKETRFGNSLVDENINSQQELIIKTSLQVQIEKLSETERAVKHSIETGIKPGNEINTQFNAVRDELDKLSFQFNETAALANHNSVISLLKQKTELYEKGLAGLQTGDKLSIASVLNTARAKEITDSLTAGSASLKAELDALPSDITQTFEKKSQQLRFWSIMVYICGALFCCFIWIYTYIKTKQSSESEKEVKASAAVKENFLANMSHEIRTPLNSVLGFTNILRSTSLNDEQKEYIEIIQTSGDNLLSIVNDILDLSKIEAGMLRIEEAPFRVSDIISAVEAMLGSKAEEKNLKLVVNVDSEMPDIVSGDAMRLTQILVNLISNAIKFTEDGGVYLRVTPVRQQGETVTLEFLVRDTGIGIPEEKQKNIFGRFEQAEASTTRRFGGTGLGLSIVKNLIELQKGTISLYSKEGVGSSFTLELPYKISDEKLTKTESRKITINPDSMKTDTKILIAEDNAMNQRLIKHLMKNWNFNYDLVFNGAQALEALKKQSYDLVLMDIQMPEMDGYTATAQIRSKLRSDIPIIAMTAHAMAGEREKCLKAGMDDYLSKPIDEAMLFELIQKYSAKAAAKDAASAAVKTGTTDKEAKIIDLNVINKYAGGDQQFKKEMIQEFITAVPSSINSLESAIKLGNYDMIKHIAHDMKTTVHVMGLTILIGHLLMKIEEYAYSNAGLSFISQLFIDVKHICLQAVQEAGRLVA